MCTPASSAAWMMEVPGGTMIATLWGRKVILWPDIILESPPGKGQRAWSIEFNNALILTLCSMPSALCHFKPPI
jgi:hypothetical protein